jgi:hypothetical protein
MASMVLVDSTLESLTSSVNAPLGLSVKVMILGFRNGVGVFMIFVCQFLVGLRQLIQSTVCLPEVKPSMNKAGAIFLSFGSPSF